MQQLCPDESVLEKHDFFLLLSSPLIPPDPAQNVSSLLSLQTLPAKLMSYGPRVFSTNSLANHKHAWKFFVFTLLARSKGSVPAQVLGWQGPAGLMRQDGSRLKVREAHALEKCLQSGSAVAQQPSPPTSNLKADCWPSYNSGRLPRMALSKGSCSCIGINDVDCISQALHSPLHEVQVSSVCPPPSD